MNMHRAISKSPDAEVYCERDLFINDAFFRQFRNIVFCYITSNGKFSLIKKQTQQIRLLMNQQVHSTGKNNCVCDSLASKKKHQKS